MESTGLRCLAASLVAVGFLGCPQPRTPPNGDYGDAPDDEPTGYPATPGVATIGEFPSLYNSANVRLTGNRGIVHLSGDPPLRFGRAITLEADAAITDADADDGNLTLVIGPLGQNGTVMFDLTASGADPDVENEGFVNVLLDLNQDGSWAEYSDPSGIVEEWVVRNFPVSVRQGSTRRLAAPPFQYGATSARTLLWGRMTVTSSPIDPGIFATSAGWDGGGPPAGYDEGETEDWFFPCEGSLDVAYPPTADNFNNRITMLPAPPVPPRITITNTAPQAVRYVLVARSKVAVPFGAGYFYVDTNRANPEWTLTLVPVAPLAPGVVVTPSPVSPAPDQLFTVEMPPGAAVTLDITAMLHDPPMPTVLDPTRPPTPPGGENRLGSVMLHPLGPCLLSFTRTNDEPVFLQWP